METRQITCKTPKVPELGEIVLVVADEKDRGEWKKGKVRHIRGKGGLSEDYHFFTRDTRLTDCLTLCAHRK